MRTNSTMDIIQTTLIESSLTPTLVAPEWKQLVVDWLINFRSDRTRQAYRDSLHAFFTFCPQSPTLVTQSDIIRWKFTLENNSNSQGKLYSRSTINQRLSALSSFYTFAVERGLCSQNPCNGVKRQAINPYGKATFLDGEQGQDFQLLNAVNTHTSQGKRDYALLLMFLTTAVRLDAIANLRLSDLRRQGESLFMTYNNKGGEVVEKRLHQVTAQAINIYLADRGTTPSDAPVFTITERGRKAAENLNLAHGKKAETDKPLSARSIQKLVKKYADKAFGKGHGITTHSLRHTAAVNAIQDGASVLEVSKLLRHKNIGVTTIYIQHISDKADDKVSRKLDRRYSK